VNVKDIVQQELTGVKSGLYHISNLKGTRSLYRRKPVSAAYDKQKLIHIHGVRCKELIAKSKVTHAFTTANRFCDLHRQ
jgi:hypothetical protein